MKFALLFLFIQFLLVACTSGENTQNERVTELGDTSTTEIIVDTTTFTEAPVIETYLIDTLEQSLIDAGLVNIEDIIIGILTDVRYSSENNFMHRDVYGALNRIYLQPSVAADLQKSQEKLKSIDSTLTLLVFDGVRPRSVQQYMWDILDMPSAEKSKFVSNPKNGSLHNYGAAVDLTIADSDGNPLDMGADYDEIGKIAYPKYEKAYLDSGMITSDQIANRELLRTVMKAGGFWGIQTEWWHFNRYNRAKAQELFEIVE